jgi:pimeloyl-ACP methyl ester carboxylesterase
MSRPGNANMQFELNCDYKTHIDTFPVFQEYFRNHQPRAIVIWGKHDVFFSIEEAHCYKRDLPGVQVHILDGGHWALETNFDEVLGLVNQFMSTK